MYLWVLRLLIWCGNTSKVGDLSSTSLLVQTLGISLLRDFDGNVDENLNERNRIVSSLTCRCM